MPAHDRAPHAQGGKGEPMGMDRIAGAPISWGVCEVPGWGLQLPSARVLEEMGGLGLAAAEFGPDGFLPSGAAERAALLRRHGLRPVGGFVPAVLHDPERDPLPEVERALSGFGVERSSSVGAGPPLTLVLAAATGLDGYDERPVLNAAAWTTLLGNLDRIAARAAELGVQATLHPHVGTVVERREEVHRVLDGAAIPLCLDTGHLLIGGTDPVELAARAPDRIAHVHLKDVDAELADGVRCGRSTYTDAVRAGIYRPLGAGDVDVAALLSSLEGVGYDGWYVLEQDVVLADEPAPGTGPCDDVRASLGFLAGVLA
ncbi:TIM barrel protein [Actinomadura xylanilytica]|uniref:TIM barrel protein n=1 Tax=Actinomadura xylanilytica TaxID=887459 RepID=UPI00255A9168|nr:TIM barrel protein [Actinomadura xylanilytica]MDL4774292.1 TIM barrel protein [Actinomadura xylanilytica]